MTVQALIKELMTMPRDLPVVIADDKLSRPIGHVGRTFHLPEAPDAVVLLPVGTIVGSV